MASRLVVNSRPASASPRRSFPWVLAEEGAVGAWDWTAEASEGLDDPSVDQLGGNVDLALWNQATAYGSDPRLVAMTTLSVPTSMGGKAIVAHYGSAVQLATGGIYMPTVAGNFVYAMRLGFQHRDNLWNTTLYSQVAGVYLHSPATIPNTYWYGVGVQRSNSVLRNSYFGATERSVSNWWSVGGNIAYTYAASGFVNSFDVWLKKAGTTLEAWGAIAGSPPVFLQSWSLGGDGANAGLIGMRVNKSGTDASEPVGILYAFARVSDVPGLA